MASALDTLKKLASKKAVEGNAAAALTTQLQDPALAGAKRDKNVVRLGEDAAIAAKAKEAAELKAALEEAEARFSMVQTDMRAYGAEKRELYNDTFKADVTTVAVPFRTEVPGGPGEETKYVSVVCTNRYTVSPNVLNHKEVLGSAFARLFVEERSKTLKPNAEELVRGLLGELGMAGEDLENAMDTLFDEKVKVSASKDYEKEVKTMPDELRAVLGQLVTRVSPSLKF
jgi:hypothetical protein